MATRKITHTNAPAGLTAKQVLAHVEDGDMTKASAVKYLQARVDRDLSAGRIPKFPTRKALETLTGKPVDYDREAVKSRKARKAERVEAAAPAKPAKRTRKAKAKAEPAVQAEVTVEGLLAQLGEIASTEEILAAFLALK